MPDKALKKFLEEVVKCELAQLKIREKKLDKYTHPKTKFYKKFFPKPKYGKTHEDIVKVVHDIEKSPEKAEVITRCKYDKLKYCRYIMTKREGKWLMSDYGESCAVCEGEGCEDCNDGWIP